MKGKTVLFIMLAMMILLGGCGKEEATPVPTPTPTPIPTATSTPSPTATAEPLVLAPLPEGCFGYAVGGKPNPARLCRESTNLGVVPGDCVTILTSEAFLVIHYTDVVSGSWGSVIKADGESMCSAVIKGEAPPIIVVSVWAEPLESISDEEMLKEVLP